MASIYSRSSEEHFQELEYIQRIETAISSSTPEGVKLCVSNSELLELPQSIYELLKVSVHLMAEGKTITLVPVSPQITTTKAAEILNISRPYLTKLLDEGAIPYNLVGTHRRIGLEDVLSYKKRMEEQRKEGLEKLARLSEEYELYNFSYEEDKENITENT